jgi:hypothetical protein
MQRCELDGLGSFAVLADQHFSLAVVAANAEVLENQPRCADMAAAADAPARKRREVCVRSACVAAADRTAFAHDPSGIAASRARRIPSVGACDSREAGT